MNREGERQKQGGKGRRETHTVKRWKAEGHERVEKGMGEGEWAGKGNAERNEKGKGKEGKKERGQEQQEELKRGGNVGEEGERGSKVKLIGKGKG